MSLYGSVLAKSAKTQPLYLNVAIETSKISQHFVKLSSFDFAQPCLIEITKKDGVSYGAAYAGVTNEAAVL